MEAGVEFFFAAKGYQTLETSVAKREGPCKQRLRWKQAKNRAHCVCLHDVEQGLLAGPVLLVKERVLREGAMDVALDFSVKRVTTIAALERFMQKVLDCPM